MKLNKSKIFNEIERLGKTPSQFYKENGWSRQYWNWLITSEPTLKKVEKLAEPLGFKPMDLLI